MDTALMTGVEVKTDSLVAVLTHDLEAQRERELARLSAFGAGLFRRRLTTDSDARAAALGDTSHNLLDVEWAIRGTRLLLEAGATLARADAEIDRVAHPKPAFRLHRVTMASPLVAVVEFSPYFAVGLTAALVFLGERLATFRTRTNAINRRNELEAEIAKAALDQVYQGRTDMLALALRDRRDMHLPTAIDVYEPEAEGEPTVELRAPASSAEQRLWSLPPLDA